MPRTIRDRVIFCLWEMEGWDSGTPWKKRRVSTVIYQSVMTSDITLQDVYQEIQKIRKDMVRHEDIDALVDTIEIMSCPETLDLLKKSDEDIRKGRVKEVRLVEDLLSGPCQ